MAQYIDVQVKAGRFRSADDAVNAAVARLQAEEELLAEDLDDADAAAFKVGLAQTRSR